MRDIEFDIPPSKIPYAIVIGLDCFTGLQTARILARRKVPVVGIAGNLRHACARTRVCRRTYSANLGNEDFIQLLGSLRPHFNLRPVLFPCTDMSVFLISEHRERLQQQYTLALPEKEAVRLLMDKIQFYTFAQREGFPIPGTFFLRNRTDVEKASRQLTFPVILKPPMRTPKWEANSAFKVYKIESAEELLNTYQQTSQWADLLMVQEWIPGGDDTLYSLNAYFDENSRPLATFVARKIRQWPPETGTSSLGEEVRNDVVLREGVRLFQHVNYKGLGYLEMKRDPRTGNHYIIEPNIGRPTGRSAISEAGGVELLYTKYCDLVELPLPANRVQRHIGAKWIYLRRDLQSAYAYWKRGKLTLGEWRRSLKGKKFYAVFSWKDPLPFFIDIYHTFFKKVARKQRQTAAEPPAKVSGRVGEEKLNRQAS